MTMPELWFVIVAVLFVGYFLLEGFDFGVGMLMPVVGRRTDIPPDVRRRVALNTIGPVWDGNEVWLITAGGALFAAFPDWYATLFSGFYIPLLIILVALIIRIVAIEWRAKIDDDRWRQRCDWGIVFGSWVPAILWGVAFANIVRGVAIDSEKQVTSNFFDLLNPYALLGGVTTALVFALHGAVFLALKSADDIREDAVAIAAKLAIPAVPVAGAFVLWTQIAYGKGWTWVLVAVAAAALVSVVLLTRAEKEGWAFTFTSVAVVSTVTLLFASLYPNVMPSTLDPSYSLTIENASSSPYTLTVMTWVAAFMTPVVVLYQGWTYWVFRQRISSSAIGGSHGLTWAKK
ncbi:cytochrome d ubiquinol oxidase subunit II [Rhodococcoides kyotonense]|uniref:Cytochrome d ubiquinol oxidase subunit II n=1 Tax=Rhodococcoides kyotonense TaxID=398843 RepID=A0A239M946_9NOCA|nr:cytochrome d ubiquinol oxidase subunit II [Rhodococcus kyotonensis]SNT38628.1 cytochrome d ubiquinol oxidase subunit II [Rhodococcus kyotonensis]